MNGLGVGWWEVFISDLWANKICIQVCDQLHSPYCLHTLYGFWKDFSKDKSFRLYSNGSEAWHMSWFLLKCLYNCTVGLLLTCCLLHCSLQASYCCHGFGSRASGISGQSSYLAETQSSANVRPQGTIMSLNWLTVIDIAWPVINKA